MKKISVVTPIYNEAESLPILFVELTSALAKIGDFEIIAVNDGSRDATEEVLEQESKKYPQLKVINFRVNRGQSAAITAGIEKATGDIYVTIDSDLENDPHDIVRLIKEFDQGYDVVSGWRQGRWAGSFITRKLPSLIANKIISVITGVHLHDYGCILKAYKKTVIQDVKLYGEMHRFIPAYAVWNGARVTEIPVNFRQRRFGRSNYGITRTFRVLLDLIVIKFLARYMNRPMHFFGGIGIVSGGIGLVALAAAFILKAFEIRSFVDTPLPIFAALGIIVGVQLVTMGVVAEMIMRTYYESQNKKPYSIKSTHNL